MVLLPEEAGMTLSELRQMAARQQHQIEAQQQLLVAKEQRLKFLKQQEARHHNLSEQQLDTACLQNLREKVETQELKLRQLRALRGQVEQQKTNNGNLGTELDSIRALFSEKEKELNLAVNKVEELTRQLDEIRNNNNKKNCIVSPASAELENLRRELAYRTKLTEQQNNYICQQQENIALRQQDISLLDKKISELTKRLQRKRLLNEQLASQIHNASLSPHNSGNPVVTHNNNGLFYATTIVSVEPVLKEQEPEHTQDDMAAKLHGSHKGFLEGFSLAKNDPKYQTLPYNTKFTLKGKSSEESSLSSAEEESWSSVTITNSSIANQQSLSVKPSPNLGNLTPQPFSNSGNPVKPVPKSMPQQSKASNCLVPANNKDTSQEKISIPIKIELPAAVPAATYGNNQQNSVTKENALNLQNVTKSRSQIETNRTNKLPKPIVPPKPVLPIKPMPPVRQSSVQKDQKTSQTNDALNNALSVLQNKSSEKDKSAISNYRERLLYYRCVPRYQHRDHTSEITNKSTSRIATYFPKPSTTPSDPNNHNTSKPAIDSSDVTDVPKRKSSFGQLPIRPKPLTIRKTPGLEPPKLKNQQNANAGLQRKTSDSNILATHMKTSLNSNFYMKSEPPQVVAPVQQPEMAVEEDVPITITASTNREEDSSKTVFVAKSVDVAIVEDVPSEVAGDVEIVSESKAPQEEESAELDEETSDSSEADSLEPKPDPPEIETVDLGKKEVILQSAAMRRVKGNLKSENSVRSPRRVSFDPLALLLDAALEGELELVKKTSGEVPNPSAANDEGITALHNAICAGHVDVVTFLVEFGCDVNAQDSDGWTPLHCAASCNNLPMVKFLVERGACVFATTLSDHETAAEKCEEEEEGFDGCSEYLYSLQENLGVMNNGVVYAVYDYDVQNADELTFKDGDKLEVLRKGDDEENEWWWSRLFDEEGYVPRNLLGLYPRVTCQKD